MMTSPQHHSTTSRTAHLILIGRFYTCFVGVCTPYVHSLEKAVIKAGERQHQFGGGE